MENNNQNLSQSVLKATVTNTPVKSKADQDYDDMNAEMEAELKAKANGLMVDQVLKTPIVANALKQAMTFLPMLVKKGESFLENGKVTILAYIDEETGAFVIEKAHNDKIELVRKEDPNPSDFFIIEKKDLDNPEAFLKIMQAKVNLNLF